MLHRLIHFERRQQPLLSTAAFGRRLAGNATAAGLILAASLGAGMIGYYFTSDPPHRTVLDALYRASMILTGMGPVDADQAGPAEKLFASFYALFSGVVFLVSVGVLLAPIVHRAVHRFHLESEEDESGE